MKIKNTAVELIPRLLFLLQKYGWCVIIPVRHHIKVFPLVSDLAKGIFAMVS